MLNSINVNEFSIVVAATAEECHSFVESNELSTKDVCVAEYFIDQCDDQTMITIVSDCDIPIKDAESFGIDLANKLKAFK